MSLITDITKNAEDQVVDALTVVQDTVVGAVKTWAEIVAPLIPSPDTLPFGDQLPKPAEVVETTFGFAERVLATQKKFVEELAAAVTPSPEA